jgi:hypothetical protein
MAGGDTFLRQSAATEFLVQEEIPASDIHAHFNIHMEMPTWALAVSDDRNVIKDRKTNNEIGPVLAGSKLLLPKEQRKIV